MFINHFNHQWSENNSQLVRNGINENEEVQYHDEIKEKCRINGSANLITTSSSFGSLASITLDGEREVLKRNLSHSTSSGSSSSRRRTNSSTSSSSSDSVNPSSQRHYSTLPHSTTSHVGLHLKLSHSNVNSCTLPLSNSSASPARPHPVKKSSSSSIVRGSSFTQSNGHGHQYHNSYNHHGYSSAPAGPPLKCAGVGWGKGAPPWAHPHLVATVSSPGGSTCTTLVVPSTSEY